MAIFPGVIQRHLQRAIERSLSDSPVVFLQGARQVGKSTLAETIAGTRPGMAIVTLDDLPTLVAARQDPAAFVARFPNGVLIDEVQRAPELLLPIKRAVDRDRTPGRYLLTGSTQALALPALADSLAGRMESATLWSFSQGEIEGHREGFLDALFSEAPPDYSAGDFSRADLDARMLRGGYPEAFARPEVDRRAAWFAAYASAIVQRDIRELARIDALGDLDRLLRLVASRTSQLTNVAEFSRVLGLPQTTLKRYLQLLEAVHLVRRVEAWAPTTKSRLARTPKLLFTDTGLAAHLADVDARRLEREPVLRGQWLESFVVGELQRQSGWSRERVRFSHFRDASGREVDLVIEGAGGRVVGVEIKSGPGLESADARGLEALRQQAGNRFHRGIVLHGGVETLPFGRDLWSVPIEALWRLPARA